MNILVISDVHSNPYALEAILDRYGDADAIWALGDYIGFFPHPEQVVRTLDGLPNLTAVKGNWEHCYLAHQRGADICEQPGCGTSERVAAIMREGFARVTPHVAEYIASLPDSVEVRVDGESYHLAHAAAYDPFAGTVRTIKGLLRSVAASEAGVFLNGDSHLQRQVACRRRLFLNPGAVSWPSDGHLGADCMTIDTGEPDGPQARFHTVPYDVRRAYNVLRRTGLPSVENFLVGKSI